MTFYSIDKPRVSTLKIRRSVFICTLAPVATVDAAKDFISRVSKENKTATHNCWAYVIGDDGRMCHSSDAGEPTGTAGVPMLTTLQKNRLVHVAAVVTRHFGGIKLGIRGLMAAYSASVQAAIDQKKPVKQLRATAFCVELGYDVNDTLMNLISPYLVRIVDTAYTDRIVHQLDISAADESKAVKVLTQYQSMGKLQFHKK